MGEFVRAIIERDGRFLILKEQWSNGIRWVFPGGKVDESDDLRINNRYQAALIREVREETGMEMTTIQLAYEHTLLVDGIEWTGFYCHVEASGEPQILEPHKCLGMQWATPEEISSLPHIEGTIKLPRIMG